MSLLLFCQQNFVTNHLKLLKCIRCDIFAIGQSYDTEMTEATERPGRSLANAEYANSQVASTCHVHEFRPPPSSLEQSVLVNSSIPSALFLDQDQNPCSQQ